MLTEEVQAMLDDQAQSFEGALEESNPPPEDQLYAQVITKVSARKVTARKTGEVMTVVRVGLKVVDDGPWKNYGYIHDFWPGSYRELVTFAQVQAGTSIKGGEVGRRLSESIGQTVFHTEINRTKSEDGREFVHIKALKKLSIAPTTG